MGIRQEMIADTIDMKCRMNRLTLPDGAVDLLGAVRDYDQTLDEYEKSGRPESAKLE